MLQIVKYIKEHGLAKAVNDFKLVMKEYPHKVLLKYNQIESDMSLTEVQECRGLILEKDSWAVMCIAFKKFFNNGESNASKIDWSTAKIFEKCDGSLLTLYFDWFLNEWKVSTTGTAEAEGEVNNKLGTTFSSLFFDLLLNGYNVDLSKLDKNSNYMFELMTPYNIVVTPHKESKLRLLATRNLLTLEEYSFDELLLVSKNLGIELPIIYDLNKGNFGALIKTFDNMPFYEEGYIVTDGNNNRVKVKNPSYVAAHHLKSKTAEHHILEIVKTNEVDEFIATFPERQDEIFRLRDNYNSLIIDLENIWSDLPKPKNITPQEKKRFAMNVFELAKTNNNVKQFSGLFFALKDGKVSNVKEFMFNYDNKMLYKIL